MIKTYSNFCTVVSDKCNLYAKIPTEHLSEEGQKVYDLYKAVHFLIGFAHTASELLDLMDDDFAVEIASIQAARDSRVIRRCLERLSDAENRTADCESSQ